MQGTYSRHGDDDGDDMWAANRAAAPSLLRPPAPPLRPSCCRAAAHGPLYAIKRRQWRRFEG